MSESLKNYYRFEDDLAIQGHQWLIVLGLTGLIIVITVVLPLMPPFIFVVFQQFFHLKTWPDIILFNVYLSVYSTLLLIGLFDLMKIWVLPHENQALVLYWSKPITRFQYLRAKLLPLARNIVVMGLVLMGVAGEIVGWLSGRFDFLQFVAATAILISFVLCLLALLNWLLLFVTETYYATLIGFSGFMLTLLPISLYLYRPDIYDNAPILAALLAFPANLLWYPDTLPRIGILIVLGLWLATAAFVGLAHHRLMQLEL